MSPWRSYIELAHQFYFQKYYHKAYPSDGNRFQIKSFSFTREKSDVKRDVLEIFLPRPGCNIIFTFGNPHELWLGHEHFLIDQPVVILLQEPLIMKRPPGSLLLIVELNIDLLGCWDGQRNNGRPLGKIQKLIDIDPELACSKDIVNEKILKTAGFQPLELHLCKSQNRLSNLYQENIDKMISHFSFMKEMITNGKTISDTWLNQQMTIRILRSCYLSVTGFSAVDYWKLYRFRKAFKHFCMAATTFRPDDYGFKGYNHFFKETIRITGSRPHELKYPEFVF